MRTDEPYLQHERLQALKSAGPATVQQALAVNTNIQQALAVNTNLPSMVVAADQRAMPPPSLTFPLDPGHTTDSSTTSDRLAPLGRSEDELSGVSSHSPHRPRQGGRRNTTGTTTPSSTGSRTSPSTLAGSTPSEQAKKKVGRSARNSANLASSTLQEDLMKLISPDYEEEQRPEQQASNVQDSPLSKLPKKTLSELSMMKSRSRENIAGVGAADNASAEVSFHMARPATVISNTSANSSPNVSNLSANEMRQSPHVSNVSIKSKVSPTVSRTPPKQETSSGAGLPNPETRPGPGDMDWTSLVDTATKAIYSSSPVPAAEKTGEDSVGGLTTREEEVRALLERVSGLEEELAGERRDRGELEAQVDPNMLHLHWN